MVLVFSTKSQKVLTFHQEISRDDTLLIFVSHFVQIIKIKHAMKKLTKILSLLKTLKGCLSPSSMVFRCWMCYGTIFFARINTTWRKNGFFHITLALWLQFLVFQTNVNHFESVAFGNIEQTLDEYYQFLSQEVASFQMHRKYLIRYHPQDLLFHKIHELLSLCSILTLQITASSPSSVKKKFWLWCMIHFSSTPMFYHLNLLQILKT